MSLPSYPVSCKEYCYDKGLLESPMIPTHVIQEGSDWVMIGYRCSVCGEKSSAMFSCSLSDLRDMVSA